MNEAATFHNMTIQYSMAWNPAILQTTTLQAVTQIRGSGDYTPGSDSWKIGGTSLFYWALGVVASKDTLWTTPSQPGCPKPGTLNCTEPNVELQMITATLSHGPVGPGDRLNLTDATLAMRSCDAAGRILRPRAPLTPVEGVFSSASFIQNRALMPWGATVGADSSYGGAASPDAFVILHASSQTATNVTVAELAALPGATPAAAAAGARYVAVSLSEVWAGAPAAMQLVDEAAPLAVDLSNTLPPRRSAEPYGYWLLAPVGAAGWALLGELEKVVPLSAQRVRTVVDAAGSPYAAKLVGVPGEVVTISAVNAAASPLTVHSATCTLDAAGTGSVAVSSAGTWGCGQ